MALRGFSSRKNIMILFFSGTNLWSGSEKVCSIVFPNHQGYTDLSPPIYKEYNQIEIAGVYIVEQNIRHSIQYG